MSVRLINKVKNNTFLSYHRDRKTDLYINSNIVVDYISDNNKNIKEISNLFNYSLYGVLYSVGLMEEIIYLYDIKPCDNFILNNGLDKFPHLHKISSDTFKSKFNPDVNLNDKSTVSLEKEFQESNSLLHKINIYAELFNRAPLHKSEIIKKTRPLPIISSFYNHYLFKYDKEVFIKNLIGKDLLVSHLLLIKMIEKEEKISLTTPIINSIYYLFDKVTAKKILSKLNKTDSEKLLTSKIESLTHYLPPTSKNGKKAIFLSGQFRGAEKCLNFWLQFARENDCPIYISTWENIGLPSGEHGNKLQRLLPESISSIFNGVSDNEFFTDNPGFSTLIPTGKAEDILKKIIINNKDLDIKYKIHSEDNFNSLNKINNVNQAKMFYNIEECFSLCSNVYDFENIIWARVDLDVGFYNYSYINDNTALTSFTGDGQQCGDFIIQLNSAYTSFFSHIYSNIVKRSNNSYFNCFGPGLIGKHLNYNGLIIGRFGEGKFKNNGLKSPQIDINEFINQNKKTPISNKSIFEKLVPILEAYEKTNN